MDLNVHNLLDLLNLLTSIITLHWLLWYVVVANFYIVLSIPLPVYFVIDAGEGLVQHAQVQVQTQFYSYFIKYT